MTGKAPFSRTAIAACGVGVAVLGAALTGPGVAPAAAGTPATSTSAGTASATATSYKVNPTTASLSLGLTFGASLAGYTNQVAQAESRGLDLGIIGSTLAGEGCDGGDPTLPADRQPVPLRADSRESGPAEKSESEKYLPFITKSVQATNSPLGKAKTVTAPVDAAGALVKIGATESQAITQLVNGNREAIATVDIAGITIAGIVEIAGLHWEAKASSGTLDDAKGTFTLGKLKVAGQTLPTNDPAQAFNAANTILSTLGIQLIAPQARTAAGILFVDPLIVRVVPNAQRDALTALLLGAVQPMRESLVDILLEQDCGNDTYITVADIVLGSLTGAGSFGLELGGVQAKAEALKATNFLNGTQLGNTANDNVDLGGFTAFDSNNSLGALGSDTSSAPSTSVLDTNRGGGSGPALASTFKGSRGGKMAIVGLLGLFALLAFAERDRRLMRRAQRASLEG